MTSGDRFVSHPVLWQNGSIVEFSTGPADASGFAAAINDRGQIVGASSDGSRSHDVVWGNGAVSDLGTLPGGIHSEAWGINGVGQTVGQSHAPSLPAGGHAVLWTREWQTRL